MKNNSIFNTRNIAILAFLIFCISTCNFLGNGNNSTNIEPTSIENDDLGDNNCTEEVCFEEPTQETPPIEEPISATVVKDGAIKVTTETALGTEVDTIFAEAPPMPNTLNAYETFIAYKYLVMDTPNNGRMKTLMVPVRWSDDTQGKEYMMADPSFIEQNSELIGWMDGMVFNPDGSYQMAYASKVLWGTDVEIIGTAEWSGKKEYHYSNYGVFFKKSKR